MNPSPRVLFVTRRFWPLSGDMPWYLLALASWMRQAGWQAEIVTALWHAAWPSRIDVREVPVHRIGPAPSTPFRNRRYLKALIEWIESTTSSAQAAGRPFEYIWCESSAEEAHALLARAAQLPPIVLRYDSLDAVGPLSLRLRERTIAACHRAAQVLVPHAQAERELIAAGISPVRTRWLPDRPASRVARDPSSRSAARRALADINFDLFLRSDDRLCVCLSELTKRSGVEFVVRSLAPLLCDRRGYRLWVVGDGPERMPLVDLLRRAAWKHDVFLPGSFEDPDLVLAAADLCVVPSVAGGASWILPTCIASAVPVLLENSSVIGDRWGPEAAALSFEPGDSQTLQALVSRWCDDPTCFQSQMQQLSRRMWSDPPHLNQWRYG